MDFKNANELLTLCEEQNISISEVMRNREIITGECPAKEADQKMARVLEIMKEAARSPIEKPIRSMGGLIGGEAQKLAQHSASGQGLCGELLEKAITYAMATLETNASMGLIVASPTAGSAGIVPGLLLAFQEVYHFSDKEIQQVLFNAGAVGYLAMRNATVAGISQLIPFDEMLEAMYKVGKRLPVELRETALSGCATTPSACEACHIHA